MAVGGDRRFVLTIAVGAGLWFAHSRGEPPPRVVPLTTFAGMENFPSFSPMATKWSSEW
jgi:hypothetical protein